MLVNKHGVKFLFIFYSVLFSCSTTHSVTKEYQSSNDIWNIGHRGDETNCLENTFSSFIKAYLGGADFIEFDLHLTKDGQVVAYHDKELDRNINCNQLQNSPIASLDYAEIIGQCNYIIPPEKTCEIPPAEQTRLKTYLNKNGKLAIFKDILELNQHIPTGLFIELKAHMTTEVLSELLAVSRYRPANFFKKIKIISFYKNTLLEIRKIIDTHNDYRGLKDIELYLLVANAQDLLVQNDLFDLDGVAFSNPNLGTLDELDQFMTNLNTRHPDKKKFVWTIKNKSDLEKFKKVKINGIINSLPGEFNKL